jgi:hypothetical protein
MKRGVVERDIDVSGVTGTGKVSNFVINDDGRVVIFWPVGIGVWPSLEDAIKVHGHNGKTKFIVTDDEVAETSHCDFCHEDVLKCPKHDFGCPGCLAGVSN